MIDIADEEAAGGGRAWRLGVAAEAEVGIAHGQEGLALMEPWGLWQLAQPSRRAGCSKTTGLVCAWWHWAHDSFSRAMASPPGRFMMSWPWGSWHWTQFILPSRTGWCRGRWNSAWVSRWHWKQAAGSRPGLTMKFVPVGARGDVFAGRAVAGFATILPGHARLSKRKRAWRTGGKDAGDVGVAIGAGLVAHESCAFNLRRRKTVPPPVEQESSRTPTTRLKATPCRPQAN